MFIINLSQNLRKGFPENTQSGEGKLNSNFVIKVLVFIDHMNIVELPRYF